MNKIILRIFIFFCMAVSLVACNTYEFPESLFAVVETDTPVVKEKQGVAFYGNVKSLGQKDIISFGFVWGNSQDPKINSSETLRVGTGARTGSFQANVISGFLDGRTYYVKAFVETDAYVIYGEAIKFISSGSPTPIVDQLIPDTGTWGDTIVIKGQSFSDKKTGNTVRFGTTVARVIACTESMITCTVPGEIVALTVPVTVSVAMATSEQQKIFNLTVPVIESFAPATGTFGDVVTITGKNFSTSPFRHFIYFNDHAAQILESTRTTIKIKVPNDIVNKLNTIKVVLNKQTAESADKFEMLPPSVSDLSTNSGTISSTVQINGSNFNPLPQGNTVTLGGNVVTVTAASSQQLTVTIPPGTYQNQTNVFKITVAEQTVDSPPFTITN